MSKLDDRFEALRRVGTPDLWEEIERRAPRIPGDVAPTPARRVGVAVVAFVVAIAGSVLLARWLEPAQEAAPPPALGAEVPIGPAGNGAMVFLASDEPRSLLLSDVYVASPGGQGPSSIAAAEGPVGDVRWSSDGGRIAYLRSFGPADGGEVVSIAPDGSDPRAVLNVGSGVLQGFTWSPDEAWIVFSLGSQTDAGLDYDLFARPAAGGADVRLTEGPADDVDPSWSPDGTRIAFTRDPGGGGSDVWVMDADGSDPHALTSAAGSEAEPTWSPDGARIAYATIEGIDTIGADGSGRRRVYSCGAGQSVAHPRWSPDGQLIAFDLIGTSGSTIAVLPLGRIDDGPLMPFASNPEELGVAATCCASWQPLPTFASSVPSPTASERAGVSSEIDVGSGRALVVGGGSVWVAIENDRADGSGTLLRIAEGAEPPSIIDRIPLRAVPSSVEGGAGIAFGDGVVWVGGTSWSADGSGRAVVSRVDADGSPPTAIPLTEPSMSASEVGDLAVVGDRLWVYVSNERARRPAELVALDVATGSIVLRTGLDTSFHEARIVGGFGSLWLTIQQSVQRGGEILRIDPATGETIARIPWEGDVAPLAATRSGIWVANGGQPRAETGQPIGAVDPATNDIELVAPDAGFTPFLVHDADSGLTWYRVSTEEGFRIAYLRLSDRDGGSQTEPFPADDPPIALGVSRGSTYLWILTSQGRLQRVIVT